MNDLDEQHEQEQEHVKETAHGATSPDEGAVGTKTAGPPSDTRSSPTEPLDLPASLLALLFYKGEPETYRSLARVLGLNEDEIHNACDALTESLASMGLALVRDGGVVELRTSAAASEMITALRKDELSRDLGNAGAETLAIVLYRGPVSRAEIDHIRGVNSSFILRALMMRGLVERIDDPQNKRTYRYRATTDTLAHLGISDITQLPDHHVVSSELTAFFQSHQGS